MKLSISLTEDDVAVIDRYAELGGFESRSAVVQYALRRVAASQLGDEYQAAWDDALLPEEPEWWAHSAESKAG
ncbi:MAG: ribbon-helix-helix domain-containing protein [Sporichthyaceae bacterium]